MKQTLTSRFNLSPPAILSLGFLALIALGTVLLKLPIASHEPITWLQAAFTATSAVNVTGLTVVDTGNYTHFGHTVLVLLVQTGGLGFMTFGVLIFFSLNRRMGMHSQLIAQEALGQVSSGQLLATAKSVLKISLAIELLGFIGLTLAFYPLMGWEEAVFAGFFYSISAFNNAGFSLTGDNVTIYVNYPIISLLLSTLVMMGGLGFLVVVDVVKHWRWQKFSVNTKVMLLGTATLNIGAALLFWLLEKNNANTLGQMTGLDQGAAAWLMAVTPRTAGFNIIDYTQLTDTSTLLTMMLMFIGAGSLSTTSGLKIGTVIVIAATTWAYLRQRPQVVLFDHAVAEQQIKKAFSLMSITIMMIFLSVFLLSFIEAESDKHNATIIDIAFEVISALGTVGLSRNLTPNLSSFGQIWVMFLMFTGKLGLLTLAYFIATPKPTRIKLPETHVIVG